MTRANLRRCIVCCDTFLDAEVCPSCGSALTESARALYALADEFGISEDSDWSEPFGPPRDKEIADAARVELWETRYDSYY